MWQTIQAFVEQANGVTDEQTLFAQLETTAADLGYPYWAFGALWGDPAAYRDNPAPAVRLNYPKPWIDHYFREGYDKIDPVVLVAPYAPTSITWTELRKYRPEFFDDAAGYGLKTGISIPLRAIQGTYVVCFASSDPADITLEQCSRLEVFAHGFFSAYLRIRKLSPPDHGLSARTIDVIRLSMAGLSAQEIAERLDMSTHGVYWCIKDAKKRLKCSN